MNELPLLIPSPMTIARIRALGRLLSRAMAARWCRIAEKLGNVLFNIFALAVIAVSLHLVLLTWAPIVRALLLGH
jgi:hypothetical protein